MIIKKVVNHQKIDHAVCLQLCLYNIISRWGGDEFLLFDPKTNLLEAINLADKLREKVSLCHIENINCSLGVAEGKKTYS